jgi:hypothetical protein
LKNKIQILEFTSDKIEGGNCKREVMCICFDHPTKKNEVVWDSPWEGSHGWSQSSIADHGELAREGKEGKGGGERRGAGVERHGEREGSRRGLVGVAWEGAAGAVSCSCCFSLLHVFCFYVSVRRRKQQEGEEKKGKKKKKRMKENNEKREQFVNMEIFRKKIKDNLWSWSKIIFVKEKYMSNYK